MKKKIKKIFPAFLLNLAKKWFLYTNYFKDLHRYKKHAFDFSNNKTKRHYEADLIFFYHKIEKALSLPSPRPGFGKETINHIVSISEYYINKFGSDEIVKASVNSLVAYQNFNMQNNSFDRDLDKRIADLKVSVDKVDFQQGGTMEITKKEIMGDKIDFNLFANTRYSIRNFANGEVDNKLIEDAVQIAQKTPSVCNRQSSRVYIYEEESIKNKILNFQNGNSGFGKDADKILIVTSDLKDFRGVNERHQSYVDGGMYAMSLIYALHSKGLGTCPLNLSITHKKEESLKKVAKINDSEILLMMIAVGRLPEKLKVASSPRRKAKEVMNFYS